MRTCTNCEADVVADARFCPHCGKPVADPEEDEAPKTVADPFSHTMPADPGELERVRALIAKSNADGVPVRERQAGSTKALKATPEAKSVHTTLESSVVTHPKIDERSDPSIVISGDRKASSTPVSPRANTNAQAPRRAPLMVGAHVGVLWSDGQTYPATIAQLTATHVLVRFANGHSQWVETRFVIPG